MGQASAGTPAGRALAGCKNRHGMREEVMAAEYAPALRRMDPLAHLAQSR